MRSFLLNIKAHIFISLFLTGALSVFFHLGRLAGDRNLIPGVNNVYAAEAIIFGVVFAPVFPLIWLVRSRRNKGEFNLLEEINSGVIVTDLGGKIRYTNQYVDKIFDSVSKWLHLKPHEVLGSSYYDFYPDPDEIRLMLENVSNLPYKGDLDIGSEILETYAIPIFKGGTHRWTIIVWKTVTRDRNQQRWEKVVEEQIETTSKELTKSSKELQSLSEEMQDLAEDTSNQSQDVAEFAGQVGQRIVQLVQAVEQTKSRTSVIAGNVDNSFEIAHQALRESEKASQIILDLSKMANTIGNMTQNIHFIMEQTRMLALNANIEAVKAGEAGMGFAVIANEVQELAQETASVTGEITDMINQILKKIPQSVSSIEKVQGVVNQMNDITDSIRELMLQQTSVMDEMNDHMKEADDNSQQIVEKMRDVVSHSRVTLDHVSKERQAAQDIDEIASIFSVIVGRFGEARIVTPDDIYRILTIIDHLIDAWLQKRAEPDRVEKMLSLVPLEFQKKAPADVLNGSIACAKLFANFVGVSEENVQFPKGTVTPTQTFNFLAHFLEIVEDSLKEMGVDVKELEKAKPVAGKTPNDAFGVIQMIHRKLQIYQKESDRSRRAETSENSAR